MSLTPRSLCQTIYDTVAEIKQGLDSCLQQMWDEGVVRHMMMMMMTLFIALNDACMRAMHVIVTGRQAPAGAVAPQ